MFSTPAGPRRTTPPPLDNAELLVHPQRAHAIDATERRLVALWLCRYVIWCARRRQIDNVRNALGLLAELATRRRPH